ncbi:hypothetical protein HDZ31DRAFT_32484 [Schizophyllum fasciatum]
MGVFHDEMNERTMDWIKNQHLFFVATAPREGHVNVSPKGANGMFHVVDSRTVWYEDFTGSGIETIAHLRGTNGRITIMFIAFDKPPRIIRLFGTGTVYEYGTAEYDHYVPASKRHAGSRAVIKVDIHKVGSSCGYGVPFYNYAGPRTLLERTLSKYEANNKPDDGNFLRNFWRGKNMKSIDGLPGLRIAPETTTELVNAGIQEEEWDCRTKSDTADAGGYGLDVGSFLVGIVVSMCASRKVTLLFCPPLRLSKLTSAMGSFYDDMPEWLMAWIEKQHLFFVATAPREGHVNVSPKGVEGTFHVVNSHTVWYEDLTGSGIETISHLRENGRITIMFMALDKPPRITRLFGTGEYSPYGSPEYDKYIPADKRHPGSRAVIEVNIHKVGASCGYGVPFFNYAGPRTLLERVAEKFEADIKEDGDNHLRKYWREHSLKSLDGLPGLQTAHETKTPLVNTGVQGAEWTRGQLSGAFERYGIDVRSYLAGAITVALSMGVWTQFICSR